MSRGQRTLNAWPVMTSMASPPPDADGDHAQPAGVGGVAVGADHHPAGEGVVLEDDLVDDPRPRLPESDAEAGADGAQEVVDLGVGVERAAQVGGAVPLGLDEVITVDGGGHHDPVEAGHQKLEGDDLGQCVLEGDAVGIEVRVAAPALEPLGVRMAQMVDEDLLDERERPAEALPAHGHGARASGRRPPRPGPPGSVAVAPVLMAGDRWRWRRDRAERASSAVPQLS